MKATEQTIQQVERFINKIGQKFPACEDTAIVTDIHVCANPDSGELLAYDDNGDEITRCVVEQWIGNTDDKFFDQITLQLRHIIKTKADDVDHLGIPIVLCWRTRNTPLLPNFILQMMKLSLSVET